MSHLDKYRGIIPAFYAAYDEEGKISPERIEKLAKHYLEVGVKGLYVGGSSGECIYQSVDERKLVLESVMKAVGGKMTIIAHIAAPSTKDSVELAKHAASLDVDALAAIPPIYFKLPESSIEKYWTDIVEATDRDFFIYNIPATTGYSLSPALYGKMLEHPQVVGVKNSSSPIQDVFLLRKAETKESIIFYGVDEQYLGGKAMGADGGIGGTYGVMPKLFLKLDAAFDNGEVDLAKELQATITDIIFKMLVLDGNLYDIMKQIIKINNGLDIGRVRGPLALSSDADKYEIDIIAKLIKEAEEKYC